MTYENRLPANYAFGTLTSAAAISDTTLTSTDFGTQLASGLSTTNYVPLTLQDPSTHNYEIVWVNAHTAAASTCTVVRGKEGTSARAWGNGTLWTVSPTVRDTLYQVSTRSLLPSDAHTGMRAFIQDEQALEVRVLGAWDWPRAQLRQSSAQSIAHATWTAVAFQAEDSDSVNGHDNVTNNARYTCKVAGTYEVSGAVSWSYNGTGFRASVFAKNSVAIAGSQVNLPTINYTTAELLMPGRTVHVPLALNDYVELWAYQDSGGGAIPTSVTTASAHSILTIKWLHG